MRTLAEIINWSLTVKLTPAEMEAGQRALEVVWGMESRVAYSESMYSAAYGPCPPDTSGQAAWKKGLWDYTCDVHSVPAPPLSHVAIILRTATIIELMYRRAEKSGLIFLDTAEEELYNSLAVMYHGVSTPLSDYVDSTRGMDILHLSREMCYS